MRFKVLHFIEHSITSDAGKKRECRMVLEYADRLGLVSQVELLATPNFIDSMQSGDVLELQNLTALKRSQA